MRFPKDSRTSGPYRPTSTVGLASGPPGGRRAALTLNRATWSVCHTAHEPGQSGEDLTPRSVVVKRRHESGRPPPSFLPPYPRALYATGAPGCGDRGGGAAGHPGASPAPVDPPAHPQRPVHRGAMLRLPVAPSRWTYRPGVLQPPADSSSPSWAAPGPTADGMGPPSALYMSMTESLKSLPYTRPRKTSATNSRGFSAP